MLAARWLLERVLGDGPPPPDTPIGDETGTNGHASAATVPLPPPPEPLVLRGLTHVGTGFKRIARILAWALLCVLLVQALVIAIPVIGREDRALLLRCELDAPVCELKLGPPPATSEGPAGGGAEAATRQRQADGSEGGALEPSEAEK